MKIAQRNFSAAPLTLFGLAVGCGAPADASTAEGAVAPDIGVQLRELAPAQHPPLPPDPTNRYLDDPRAAELGQKLFFDTRFSGPLLDEANNGNPGTLGLQGEAGKVACASCHVPESGFSDTRSSRGQISLGSGWTHRRALSLLDVGRRQILNWDGRHDAAFSQPFTPIEDPAELNSSRLFAAQQLAALYRADYEAIFGPMPALAKYTAVAPADAGCSELPVGLVHGTCIKPGYDDPEVTRIVVNMGKAIEAYTRQLECGPGRFDAWVNGDATALTAEEQAGAALFVGKAACSGCHRGPELTDLQFHNMGLHPNFTFFVAPIDDSGAAQGLAALRADPLNVKGPYSDGDDGRDESLPADSPAVLGAFRTPSLRCVSTRPSFMHTGQFRSLNDVVAFFDNGGDSDGYPGSSQNHPRGLSAVERAALVAFLRALDGPGPSASLTSQPDLPP